MKTIFLAVFRVGDRKPHYCNEKLPLFIFDSNWEFLLFFQFNKVDKTELNLVSYWDG